MAEVQAGMIWINRSNMAANLKFRSQETSRGPFSHNNNRDPCNIPFPDLPKSLRYGVIAFTSIVCYLNSLEYDLVHDDVFAIKENMDIRPETPLRNILSNDFWGKPMSSNRSHKSYRPLCTLTFRMNYAIHGLDPFGYHAANVVLHGVVCLLFALMCEAVAFKSNVLAFLAGLLFATHPVHTEAVSKMKQCLLLTRIQTCCMYSQFNTSLIRTPKGHRRVSVLWRRLYFRAFSYEPG